MDFYDLEEQSLKERRFGISICKDNNSINPITDTEEKMAPFLNIQKLEP